jgi:hypothetical protein
MVQDLRMTTIPPTQDDQFSDACVVNRGRELSDLPEIPTSVRHS